MEPTQDAVDVALATLREAGLFATCTLRPHFYLLGGRSVVEFGERRIRGYEGAFCVNYQDGWDYFIARVPEPGQVGTEEKCPDLPSAVAWILRHRGPMEKVSQLEADITVQRFTNNGWKADVMHLHPLYLHGSVDGTVVPWLMPYFRIEQTEGASGFLAGVFMGDGASWVHKRFDDLLSATEWIFDSIEHPVPKAV